MSPSPDILTEIIQYKTQEVRRRIGITSVDELKTKLDDVPVTRSFVGALKAAIERGEAAVIAEIKKASPSQGVIRKDFDPIEIARSYAAGGATCLSVLTDTHYFQGSDDYLLQARDVCELPVLRKDFIVDSYQIWESRAIGADCILLIASALTDGQLTDFSGLATDLSMDVLVEVHDEQELQRALRLNLPLVGINNRDLRNFHTTLATTLDLLPLIPQDRIVITESGIHSADDVALMRRHNVHGFLIGEACMRVENPGKKVRELFFDEPVAVPVS